MPLSQPMLYQSTPMTVTVYTHQEYPKMLFHPDGRLLLVQNTEEETKASGEGWVDSPAKYGVETCPAAAAAIPGGWMQQGYVAPQAAAPVETAAPPVVPAATASADLPHTLKHLDGRERTVTTEEEKAQALAEGFTEEDPTRQPPRRRH